MLTDIGPFVQRLFRQLVLAGVPLAMGAACGDGRQPIKDYGTGGATGGVNSGGTSGSGGGGGRAIGSGGSGGIASGGAGGGGGNHQDAGADAGGGHQACQPLTFTCGSPTCSGPGGTGGGALLGIPTSTSSATFDPDDARWADLYRACLAGDGGAAGCGPDCRGLCLAVLMSDGGVIFAQSYLKCEISCGSPAQITGTYSSTVCGRRPSGGVDCVGRSARAETPLGRLLAEAAELEAASVPAFQSLASDLGAHGAPAALIWAARVAAADEARHWRRTRDLAHRRGGRPVRPVLRPSLPTTIEELAIHNVIEGCVRETYGALVAAYQATTAADTDVRALMADIATDEASHAALSWQIDAWASTGLGPNFRRKRNQAARRAVQELFAGALTPIDEQVRSQAGHPAPAAVKQIFTATVAQVWGPSFA